MLDRQREQRAQPLSYLLARHALAERYGVDLEALAEVGERVADNDRRRSVRRAGSQVDFDL
ncbi:MAG: hypothetical protein M3Q30_26755 [Actinomycetota bacterium]|jgi:hypothetical protein|nr:hypothetical protein [Actinomycetota bacterium]